MSNFRKYVNFYEFESELPGTGKLVTFKPITTGQIKRLLLYETSEDMDSIEKSLDNIISECVIDEDFDVGELYLQDRFYLLLEIRKATKGNTYSFQSRCSKCESQSAQSVNLSKLEVKKLPKEVLAKPVEKKKTSKVIPMKKGGKLILDDNEEIKNDVLQESDRNIVKLDDKLSIRVTYLTRELQKEYKEYLSTLPDLTENQKMIEESTLSYAVTVKSIVTPDGEETDLTLDDKIYLIENIPSKSVEIISKWFEDNDFGVDFSFDVVCAHCEHKERKEIPLENFFS